MTHLGQLPFRLFTQMARTWALKEDSVNMSIIHWYSTGRGGGDSSSSLASTICIESVRVWAWIVRIVSVTVRSSIIVIRAGAGRASVESPSNGCKEFLPARLIRREGLHDSTTRFRIDQATNRTLPTQEAIVRTQAITTCLALENH